MTYTTPVTKLFPYITFENYETQLRVMNLTLLYESDKSRHFSFCENDRLLRNARNGRISFMKNGELRQELTDFIAEVNTLIDEGLIIEMP